MGFGPYRALLADYGLASVASMRALGPSGLAAALQELQMPEQDVDRMTAVMFARPVVSAQGGIYDQSFLRRVQPLYDMHMGVENMGPLLYSLVRFAKPRHVLEVGAGYTSIFILQALHDRRSSVCLLLHNRAVLKLLHLGDLIPVLSRHQNFLQH